MLQHGEYYTQKISSLKTHGLFILQSLSYMLVDYLVDILVDYAPPRESSTCVQRTHESITETTSTLEQLPHVMKNGLLLSPNIPGSITSLATETQILDHQLCR